MLSARFVTNIPSFLDVENRPILNSQCYLENVLILTHFATQTQLVSALHKLLLRAFVVPFCSVLFALNRFMPSVRVFCYFGPTFSLNLLRRFGVSYSAFILPEHLRRRWENSFLPRRLWLFWRYFRRDVVLMKGWFYK